MEDVTVSRSRPSSPQMAMGEALPSAATLDLDALEKVAKAAADLTTPWHPGHLYDDSHSCNCRYVLAEHTMGMICEVGVQDGTEDHAHEPTTEEAKANQLHIATFDPFTVLAMIEALRRISVEASAYRTERDYLADAQAQFAGHRTANRKATPGRAISIQDPSS